MGKATSAAKIVKDYCVSGSGILAIGQKMPASRGLKAETPSGRAWASIRINRLDVWAPHVYFRSSDSSINCQTVQAIREDEVLVSFARQV
jgi:hypothetical protein